MNSEVNVTPMLKRRDQSIDMAKGVLIAMLIFHHIVDVCGQSDVSNIVISCMKSIQKQIIVCYFMPAFFMITGICSNFDKSFMPFLKNQVKSLLIPSISFILLFHIYQGETLRQLCGTVIRLFLHGKDYWFLIALFEAKLIYWFFNKYIKDWKGILFLLLALSFCGTLLNTLDMFPNFFMHRHVFDLMLYLGVGHLAKAYYKNKKISICCLFLYMVIIASYTITEVKIPYVTYTFATPLSHWMTHVVLSVSGSILVLWLSRSIKVDALIEYMGKNSLAIFLMQWYTLFMFIGMASPALQSCTLYESVAVIASIFVSTIAIGLLVAYICEHSIFKYLMGKF